MKSKKFMNFRIRKAWHQSCDILSIDSVTLGTLSNFRNVDPISLSIKGSKSKASAQQPHN